MTRVLAELLGASGPDFRHSITSLENAQGRPSHDIRLTTELQQATRSKLRLLGLDADDTTASELYHALQERIKVDDARLEKRLRTLAATHISAEGNVEDGIVHALQHLPITSDCYALKSSVLRTLLKKQAPKRAMKQLGYRSLDSMLKHEAAASLLAAAWLAESLSWRKSFIERYKALKPSDFEARATTFLTPKGKGWDNLAKKTVATSRHNVICFKELGAVIVLPLGDEKPKGATTVVLALALHSLNDIRATSTFLKLCQVRGDFGKVVQTVARDEPYLQANVLDQPVPWHIVQRYYARAKQYFSEELFEPHIHADDLSWHSIEKVLAHIEPSFEFWHHTSHLGLAHAGQPVSLNVLDAALNFCNKLPFANRTNQYGRTSLWHELVLRYLKPETVEQAVASELQPQLVQEEVLI
ncbi:MAG TPA: hypothetical protein VFI84_02235 [Candidatus Saccharimonadales bacterium]|nr:hypothetical protein [Candidatus Saccharimonadales bacterium]